MSLSTSHHCHFSVLIGSIPSLSLSSLYVGFSDRLPIQIPLILQDLYQSESCMWTRDGSGGESGEYRKIASGDKLFLNFLYKRRTKRWTRPAALPTSCPNCSFNLAQWKQLSARGFLHLFFFSMLTTQKQHSKFQRCIDSAASKNSCP